MKMYNLENKFDSRKSFYGKAQVVELDNLVSLVSYDTTVCRIDTDTNNIIELQNWHSMTTNRHINEFLQQFGMITNKMSKQALGLLVK